MNLRFDWDEINRNIVLTLVDTDFDGWNNLILRMSNYIDSITRSNHMMLIPIKVFISMRRDIAQYMVDHAVGRSFSDDVKQQIIEANQKSYINACKQDKITPGELQERLNEVGFTRKLTNNQTDNVCKLARLYAGATFSVPGAGKTTEALAYFFYNAKPKDMLLVVAPVNAFGAWEEQLDECRKGYGEQFVRLRGGERNIDFLLRNKPRFALISYQQFPRVTDIIKNYLIYNSVFMFLDESHRIKSGYRGVSPEAILNNAYLPEKKLIMSGTPMPQCVSDLLPQFEFLYPDQTADEESVVHQMRPIFVRTTQKQLEIPPIRRIQIQVHMSRLQTEIYRSIRSETKRQLIPMLSDTSAYSLREIGKKIMKVMEFTSNPALLADDMDYIFDERLGSLLAQENGPKIDYACKRARALASEGKKVIIWTQFVQNVEVITERLRDLGADFIHGGVNAGSEDEEDTREWKIKEFHSNPRKMVLVANPAAASEGISLHKVCQYAIYVDRSFNAAHYLQSEDRIHRLGLKPNQEPTVEIVECIGTIDEVVRKRLENKVDAMSEALDDPSLNVDVIPYDVVYDEDNCLDNDDVKAVLAYFFGN